MIVLDDGPITKVCANFLPRAMVALDVAAEVTGDSQTDCLNRAIQVYALIVKEIAGGAHIRVVGADGVHEVLELR